MFNKLLVENILRRPIGFDWQVQGLGMLRMYLDASRKYRLHIWDSAVKVPGVSALHNHPWDLQSNVVAGVYKQHRYIKPTEKYHVPQEFNQVTIKCGKDAQCTSEVEKVQLCQLPMEVYGEGYNYSQAASEIHWSVPDDGTVTIVARSPKDDPDHACVFWRGRGPWVTAEPRRATENEVLGVTERALQFWF